MREMPITPQENPAKLVISVDKWTMVRLDDGSSRLRKTYRFRDLFDKSQFVKALMTYETSTGHSAEISMDQTEVRIEVWTRDLNSPTEIDKEYARFADVLFRDVVVESPKCQTGPKRVPIPGIRTVK
jgi:pterin-4a-carbinolamine dehydratase